MIQIKNIINQLSDKKFDDLIKDLYVIKNEKEILEHKNKIISTIKKCKDTFNLSETEEVAVFSSPGRTEIGGNHTDHQKGKVIASSVNVDMIGIAHKNNSHKINVVSEGFDTISFDANDFKKNENEKYTNYAFVKGIIYKFRQKNYIVEGTDIYISSNVLCGSGISSSACFEVLISKIFSVLYANDELDNVSIAMISQFSENEYYGKPSGLMDQMACSVGGIILIDFKEDIPKYEKINKTFDEYGYTLMLVDVGTSHKNLHNSYSAIPYEMKEVAHFFNQEYLATVNKDDLYENAKEITKECGDRAFLRAVHFFDENEKVEIEKEALLNNDFNKFLDTVNKSGDSSFKHLQNVSTYVDAKEQKVAFALAISKYYIEKNLKNKNKEIPYALRVHGGGFAGTIQLIVPQEIVEDLVKDLDRHLYDGATHIMNIRTIGVVKII